ncbi:dihydrofolate reductase [Segnochrobactraceae bacterium EtOH-i3]
MSAVDLVVVVAVGDNGVIGQGDLIPWRISSDMKRFKALTMGKPLIMGRRTFLSIGRPLPGRDTIVVTRDADFAAEGVEVARDLPEAVARASAAAARRGVAEAIIAGGGEIYRALLPAACRVHLTRVHLAPAGDVHFPALDPAEWREVARERPEPGPKDEAAFEFIDFARIGEPRAVIARADG